MRRLKEHLEYVQCLESQLKEAHVDCIQLQQEINCLRLEPCQFPACEKLRKAADELACVLRWVCEEYDCGERKGYEAKIASDIDEASRQTLAAYEKVREQ